MRITPPPCGTTDAIALPADQWMHANRHGGRVVLNARHSTARFISIVGHPMLVMPLATWVAARTNGIDGARALMAISAILALGLLILAFSLLQVRRGRWRHVDASADHERRDLNAFLLGVFALASLLACWQLGLSPLPLALMLSASIVAMAMLLATVCKLSLHMAFAAFAALIPGTAIALLAFGLLAAAVAWSRLQLERHVRLDLLAGLLAGAGAGIIYQRF